MSGKHIQVKVVRKYRAIIITLLLAMLCCMGISVAHPVPKCHLTGPLVIGEVVPCSNAETLSLMQGSTLYYTRDGTLQVTGPDGSDLFVAREKDATRMYGADGIVQPVSRVIIIPQEANIDPVDANTVEISRYFSDRLVLIRDDTSPLEPVLSRGVYYLGRGSAMAASAGRTTIMTRPLSWTDPEVAYMREEFGPHARIEILCTGHPNQDYSCTGFYISNQTADLTVSRAFGFSVLPGTPGTPSVRPLLFTSETRAAIDSSGMMKYTVVASSSSAGATMNISTGIHTPHEHGGPDDVFSAGNVLFTGAGPHTISHQQQLSKQGYYQAYGSVNLTVPQEYATGGNPRNYHIMPKSGILTYNPAGESRDGGERWNIAAGNV